MTDQKKVEVLGIQDLKGATIAKSEQDIKYYHTYNPDFATEKNQSKEFGVSPFITAHMQLGDKFNERRIRVTTFNNLVDNDGAELQRIARNFFTENWDNFAKGVGKYLVGWKVTEPVDRQRALFQLLEFILGPIFTSEGHANLILKMHTELTILARESGSSLLALIDESMSRGYLFESRQALVEIILRFIEKADDFRSVLPFWDPADTNASFPTEFIVTAPKEFHELKSLYVDAYEAVTRSLTIVSAVANLKLRHNHNLYLPHPTLGKKFAPKSMIEFHQKSNAPKLAYLADLPWLERWILPSLDPKLRNAIGHNSSHYNSGTGKIEYQTGGTGRIKSISYGDFLFCLLRLVRSSLQLAHLTKQLFVHNYFRDLSL